MLRLNIFTGIVGLVVLCLWLGVLTHYALSVVEQTRGKRNGLGTTSSVVAPTPIPDDNVAARSTQSTEALSPSAKRLVDVQISLLKRKLEELQRQREDDVTNWKEKVKRVEDELAACQEERAAAATTTTSPLYHRATGYNNNNNNNNAPPVATFAFEKPPALSQQRQMIPVNDQAPEGLNEYEREQWRIKQYMREQREGMLKGRRDFIQNQKSNANADNNNRPPAVEPLPDDRAAAASVGLATQRDRLQSLVRHRGPIIPVVILAYKRAAELKKCVDNILRRMPHVGFQLFASQDGLEFPDVTSLLDEYQARDSLIHMVHHRDTSGGTEEEIANGWEPYFAISHHYRFVLEQIFSVVGYERVILVEEDIEVGVDFFDYMTALSPLLDQDPTLLCVSAWNDNGKASLIADPRALYRTDFFPGLGWMMSRSLWHEVERKWPKGFWDDWLRQPANRLGRSCIRPEVPRSFTWCSTEGVSQGQFCAEHLASIKLADTPISWKSQDLSYLVKDRYDSWFDSVLASATEIHAVDELDRLKVPASVASHRRPAPMSSITGDLNPPAKEVKLIYHSLEEFAQYAQLLNLMDDFKDGVPRTAYKGVVTFRRQTIRVHLVSSQSLYQ